MMNIFTKNLALYGAFTLLLVKTSAALDLTPHPGVINVSEGPPVRVTEFADGKSKIQWLPPAGWLLDGSPGSVNLSAPDGSGAWMKLVVLKKDAPPDGNTPAPTPTPAPAAGDTPAPQDDMQNKAMRFIPAGAKDVTFIKTVPSPFVLGRLTSTEYIFTFSRYGSRDSISISFVNYSVTELVVVIISAGEKDFTKIRAAGIASLFSWRATKL
jgi:hypothetical protein